MPKHSVSEAARLAGVSRSHFYKKFIKTGLISVERDKEDKPVIDTAEIMRACGELKGKNTENVSVGQFDTHEIHSQNTALQTEVKLLREQLAAAADREKWYQDQLTSTTRLLEHKQSDTTDTTTAVQIEKLKGEVNLIKKDSMWARLFSRKEQES
jgi:hypothetical protein